MEDVLPDDMLADVLGRLPPSSLAASRCVRKHWCAIIDGRRLLRAHLLPLRLDAFYCISLDLINRLTYFFARPASPARRIPGGPLDFLEGHSALEVEDHCNGLLLVADMVVNPATRQWATLPTFPQPSLDDVLGVTVTMDQENNDDSHYLSPCFYLVYDPMSESPQHFEVFLIPLLSRYSLRDPENMVTIDLEEQEWPPSVLRTHVFSSGTWRWEERSLVRQGEPAGTMADMLQSDYCSDRKAVYFRGALYVHCQNNSVMRIALSNDKYQMIRSPGKLDATFYVGKSKKGVYFALLYRIDFDSCPQFQVWLLKEEEENDHIHMEWVLKTNISLQPLMAKPPLLHDNLFAHDEWRVIRDYNNLEELEAPPAVVAAAHDDNELADGDEWDFDKADEIVILDANKDNKTEADNNYHVDFLGFHPDKEIVFFSLLSSRTVSYNLNTSKVQLLGGPVHVPVGMRTCFPYTPCWLTMGESFENS